MRKRPLSFFDPLLREIVPVQMMRLAFALGGLLSSHLMMRLPCDKIPALMSMRQHDRAGEWPVTGHAWAVKLLSTQLAANIASVNHQLDSPAAVPQRAGLHHAYLLTGSRHIGKSTLVRAFAQTLFCTGAPAPCGQCRNCLLVAKGTHPNLIVISPMESDPEKVASDCSPAVDRDSGKIYGSQAEALIHDANLRPMEGTWKVFHIQDAERVTGEAVFNKLLKTIEEPPAHVIVFITVSDRTLMLPTVASRCQVINLQPVERVLVRRALEEQWGMQPDKAELLARLANGMLGWAVEQSQRGKMWEEREERLQQLWTLAYGDRVLRLEMAEKMAKRDARLFATLETWQGWWRDVLVYQAGLPDGVVNIDKIAEIRTQAAAVTSSAVQDFLGKLVQAEAALRHTVMPRLALDMLLLRMPYIARQ